MLATVKIMRLKGKDIVPYIPDLAKLRISVFRDYPYLYEGDLDYEYHYLETYIKCPESVIILALDENNVIGASSALPLAFEVGEFQKPFLEHHIDINHVFYFGESVLQPRYRGHNIYRHFFSEREAAAAEYGAKIVAFAAVEREENDIRKPKGYTPLNSVWEHFGYKKHPELCAYFNWKEIGETEEIPKPLIFWLKNL